MPTEQQVIEALRSVMDPELNRDLVTLSMIENVTVTDANVALTLVLTTPACPQRDEIRQAVEAAVTAVPGVATVDIAVTARVPGHTGLPDQQPLPGVANIVAVASGKGGVGKSAVAVNLAVALAETGAKVGLLDGDIYGPSIPLMLGIQERPSVSGERILPLRKYGLELMSIGFLIPPDSAVIWRGPMVSKALDKLLRETEWSALDYLIIDMPPGTGDAQLTLAQQLVVAGAVIVTTPQDVAMADAVRGISMFQKVGIPILGVVENMSYFKCPECGQCTPIFGRGTTVKVCKQHNVPFLGDIPLDPVIRESGDAGTPVVVAEPESGIAAAFRELAAAVAAKLSVENLTHNQPDGAGKCEQGGEPGTGAPE
ncbi:MAG: iron-sulfur cluster carrier protein ApbC [Armatimonadetes bacterium CG_4_10_14_3_um_filter_66_18]|nr:iron-sulfur cluster carrier protein ApbC [Armatimonadota bacterium]PIU93081.1 MAG: iron-sulfur cluster carrier protein ApbC [Armatimonadetes bacterium CG06_land_8_20_14_3_00_66_21]PIX37570.1 MAG: iron-sulfur cluster carrier protein ApbC [Armatimonadetes bacterium CG_4_8_14_3_um_filter_66_20]PIY50216.1 MAG: iron-sulfur cluster carrier protein ApbC [Armatimonadetes bacterium CG_4_10_14_3_um_filter_66_18]PIZ39034.1 MAG: iron-sulfur cluster carrier protein ApbC [Armatimonadetes bacterium CG_4_10